MAEQINQEIHLFQNQLTSMKITSRAAIIVVFLLFGILKTTAQQPVEVPVFELAVEIADTTASEWLTKGDEQYENGDLASAVACYGKAADLGLAEAQFKYGLALFFGEGIDVDYTTASMWFKRAVLQGHAKAMNNLAYCYMYGKGVPTDYDKALLYLKEAANAGCKEAQLTLAECYEKGVLVEKDEQEAQHWSNMAAAPEIHEVEAEKEEKDEDVAEREDTVAIQSPELLVDTPQENVAQPAKPTILSKEDIIMGKKKENVDESEVLVKAPVVNILFPVDNSTFHTSTIKIKYQLIAKGKEDKTKVTVMVDGVKQPTDRAVRAANTIDVDLPDHDCTVILYAQNEYGNSEPASIRLIRETKQEEKPRLLAVVVGVGKYDDPKLPPLQFTCKDAQDFSTAINGKKNFPYSEVQIKLLCDSMASRAEMFEAMEWMKQEATPNDVCMFFFAGHGFRDEKDRFYFMSYGSSTERLYNSFSSADFRREVEDVNSKLVVFVDACYSGALMEGNRSAASHFIEQLRRTKNGMVLYASSASDTKSKEDASWGNGAFTKALVEALNGAARNDEDEGLSTQQLDQFLYKEVRRLTDSKQTPIFMNPNGIEHFNLFTYEEEQP